MHSARTIGAFTCGAILLSAATLPAAVVTTHHWDMGETNVANGDVVGERIDAPGYITGSVANYTMPNLGSVGAAGDLDPSISAGGPVYSAEHAPGGSSVSIEFTGSSSDALVIGVGGNHPTTATANFAFELWTRQKDNTFNRNIAYNGQRSGSENGFGFDTVDGKFVAYMGGVQVLQGPDIVVNEWTHLALVVTYDGSDISTLVSTFYVDGEVAATYAGSPASASGTTNGLDRFYLGSNRTVGTAYGWIDEVKLHTFAPGEFDPQRDLADGYFQIPEPTALSLLVAPMVMLLARHRR